VKIWGEGEDMGTRIKSRKRIGKILVLLLASGSMLGISPLTAMAEDFTITVVVEDNTPPGPECSADPARWGPVFRGIERIDVDLSTSPPPTQTFSVDLNFYSGFDPACDIDYPVTGTLVSTWASTSTPPLNLSPGSLDCYSSCVAFDMAPAGFGGEIEGDYIIPNEVGTAVGILSIIWTPE
jgi:hypothetical protein